MEPSNNRPERDGVPAWLDGLALGGMTAGAALELQPWWSGGLRAGFFLLLAAVLLHVYTSHARR